MLSGYACAAPDDPDLLKQRRALTDAGCPRIFEEHGSGPRFGLRLGRARALKACAKDDVLIVWRLDRLGRHPPHAIEIIGNLLSRGVAVRALAEDLDTSAQKSAAAVAVLTALAKFQRDTTTRRHRIRLSPNGLGVPVRPPHPPLDRPPALNPQHIAAARRLIASGDHSIASAAREIGISYAALWRHLRSTVT
jgi:DNA invertase Pin-like site-specific DNA recombinase